MVCVCGRGGARTPDFDLVRAACLAAKPYPITTYETHKTHQMVQNVWERCKERCKPVGLLLVSTVALPSILSPGNQTYRKRPAPTTVLVSSALKKVGHSVAKNAAENILPNSSFCPDLRSTPLRCVAFRLHRLMYVSLHIQPAHPLRSPLHLSFSVIRFSGVSSVGCVSSLSTSASAESVTSDCLILPYYRR
jgi:hypothetical protein